MVINKIRKTLSLFLTLSIILSSFCFVTVLAEKPLATVCQRQDYVTVSGNVEEKFAGKPANVMIVPNNVDRIGKDDICYIGQTIIDEEGKYSFEASFTVAEGKAASDYKAVLNINNEIKLEQSLTNSVITELTTFDLDFSQLGKAIAHINNEYMLKDLGYKLIVAFYDDENALINASIKKKFTGDENSYNYYDDIPKGTAYVKAFLWEDNDTLTPLSVAAGMDLTKANNGRKAEFLTIAPGKDETERNFAWYDAAGIEGARIQYAVMESETDKTTFPSARAIEAKATYGPVDARKYDGTENKSGDANGVFRYSHDEYVWVKATVKNLTPGKTYVYRVGDKLDWYDDIYTFKTDASPNDGFKFLIFSDEHASMLADGRKTVITNLREKALKDCPDASFILSLGDNVDLPWQETAYYEYFNREGMTRYPLATVPGNTHDMNPNVRAASLFGYHFNMPNQLEIGKIQNVCGNYYFRYGDVLFIGIATINSGGSDSYKIQKEVVKAAVEANPDAKWKVLYTHMPYYYSDYSYFGSYYKEDFISDYGIDFVFSGHSHVYKRTYQMKDGKPVDISQTESDSVANNVTDPDGYVHITFNTASDLGYPSSRNKNYYAFSDDAAIYGFDTDVSYYTTHYSIVSVTDKAFTVNTYQNKCYGKNHENAHEIYETILLDSYTIQKTK